MKKNVGSQVIGVQMVNAADGTAFTGSASVAVTGDNGTPGAGGGTAPAHKGSGYHSYVPTQAETNYNHIAFTFTGTGAIPVTVQVYTTNDLLSSVMTEGYAADGAAPTLEQILFMILAKQGEMVLPGTEASTQTMTVKKLDGSTTAMTFTIGLDSGGNPISITRAT